MNPGCILLILFWSARWAYNSAKGKAPNGRWQAPFPWWVFSTVIATVLWIVALGLGRPPLLVIALLLTPCFLPWTLARWIFIPRGMVRAAYWAGRASTFVWRSSPKSGALIGALLAQKHCPQVDPRWVQWLREEVETNPTLSGPHVLVLGLFAELDGRDDLARQHMRLVLHFHSDTNPESSSMMARQWLALDAARRGAWHEILELDGGWGWYGGPKFSFLLAAARRLTGTKKRPSDWGLKLRWFLAGNRLRTRPLLHRALMADPALASLTSPAPDATHLRSSEGDVRLQALAHHVELLQQPVPKPETLITVDRAWQDAFSDADLQDHLRGRIEALGARTSASHLLAELRDLIGASLPLEKAPHLATQLETFAEFASQRHHQLTHELEEACWMLRQRYQGENPLPASQELAEICHILNLYESLVRSGGLRALALSILEVTVWNWASWLFNDRAQTPLARACFQWLKGEGEKVGNDELVSEMQHNLKCGV